MSEKMKIAVAGTGYVGLSLAVLLSQHNEVRALDIVSEKVEKINAFQSPIQDDEIELFLAEAKAGTRKLDLHATVDVAEAYTGADFAIVATPTNYDSDRNFFDTSSVEAAISAIRSVNPTGLDCHQVDHPCGLHFVASRDAWRQPHHLQPRVPSREQGALR